jgi:hypothetical protein
MRIAWDQFRFERGRFAGLQRDLNEIGCRQRDDSGGDDVAGGAGDRWAGSDFADRIRTKLSKHVAISVQSAEIGVPICRLLWNNHSH